MKTALMILGVSCFASIAGAAESPTDVAAPTTGSKYEKEIQDIRDEIALIKATDALRVAKGDKTDEEKLAETIDLIKSIGTGMPTGSWTVEEGAKKTPEAIYYNFSGLRTAALGFAAQLRLKDGGPLEKYTKKKRILLVPFGKEPVSSVNIDGFISQHAQVTAQWLRWQSELESYIREDGYFSSDVIYDDYYKRLIGNALGASGSGGDIKTAGVLPLIAAAPALINAVSSLFKNDTTESVGVSNLTDDGLYCAIAEGLGMKEKDLQKSFKNKIREGENYIDTSTFEIYLDRDAFLSAYAKEIKSDEALRQKTYDVAFCLYRGVRIKSHIDENLLRHQKSLEGVATKLEATKKELVDAKAKVVSLTAIPAGENDQARIKREEQLRVAVAKVGEVEGQIKSHTEEGLKHVIYAARMKSLSDRLAEMNTSASSFINKLGTDIEGTPLPVLLLREAAVTGIKSVPEPPKVGNPGQKAATKGTETNPPEALVKFTPMAQAAVEVKVEPPEFLQLSAKILDQGVSTVTSKYAFWTTRKASTSIALTYRISDVTGKLYATGVYADHNYVKMGSVAHVSTDSPEAQAVPRGIKRK